jgi:hypothetical protein
MKNSAGMSFLICSSELMVNVKRFKDHYIPSARKAQQKTKGDGATKGKMFR